MRGFQDRVRLPARVVGVLVYSSGCHEAVVAEHDARMPRRLLARPVHVGQDSRLAWRPRKAVTDVWDEMEQSLVNDLTKSMPRRLQAVCLPWPWLA